jgi:hypothetical protein
MYSLKVVFGLQSVLSVSVSRCGMPHGIVYCSPCVRACCCSLKNSIMYLNSSLATRVSDSLDASAVFELIFC